MVDLQERKSDMRKKMLTVGIGTVKPWNGLWDQLSNPLCWKFLKTEEEVGGCKGNWWYFGVGTMSEEPSRHWDVWYHTSVWYHCWKAMLAAVQRRGKKFRGEARWDGAEWQWAGSMPCAVPRWCDWFGSRRGISAMGHAAPGDLSVPCPAAHLPKHKRLRLLLISLFLS